LTFKKAFGFRTYQATEIQLYQTLGNLPEPEFTHKFLRGAKKIIANGLSSPFLHFIYLYSFSVNAEGFNYLFRRYHKRSPDTHFRF
jgi:hypothetical protein